MEMVGHPSADTTPEGSPAAPFIPDYRLIRVIGRGSYGEVWLARGITDAYRAIKVVWRERFPDATPFEREFNGVREFAALPIVEAHHLSILHVGKNDKAGFFYYVMELADDIERGRSIEPTTYAPLTLSSMRKARGRLPVSECVTIGAALTRALMALHERGLVHRDIKPSNIVFVNGVLKLADIGLISKSGEAQTFVGTEGFIPPEGPGTAAADMFSLGKLIYEVATGFDRNEFPRLPPDFESLPDPKAFLDLNEIIVRACAREPAKRYDAPELLRDLQLLIDGKSLRQIQRRRRRILLASQLGGALLIAAACIGVWKIVAPIPQREIGEQAALPNLETLLVQIKTLTDGIYSRDSVLAAERLAERATQLAPHSARAWAALAYCGACQLQRNWDLSTERRQAVQDAVNHALAIDRDEPIALLSWAILFRRQQAHAQSEVTARRALKADPADPRIWRILSHAIFNQGRHTEGIKVAEEAKQKFPTDPLVYYDLSLLHSQIGNFEQFEKNIDSALALKSFQSGLITKVDVAVFRHGDLAMASAALNRFSPEERADDRVVACAMNLFVAERDPARVHAAAALTASTYFADFVARGGPKGFWRALAYRQEKKPALERAQWQEAEEVLRKRRQDQTEVPSDRARLATTLVQLGRLEEAEREIASYEAAFREQPSTEQAVMLGIYYAARGDAKTAVPILRVALNRWGGVSYHTLRLHPWWDPLRGQPEFEAFLRETSTALP